MRLSERQRAILDAIAPGDYVEVRDLAERLDVDASTIRRDLQALVSADLVTRLHGGVRRAEGHGGVRRAESHGIPALLASTSNPVLAQGIATTARRMLRSGDTVALGAGVITDALVPLLFDLDELTVITTDLAAAATLSRHAHLKIVVAGGELRDAPASCVVSGAATAAFLEAQQSDWAFLEVCGVHPFAGLTSSTPWRISADRAMLQRADRRVILAPSAAFGTRCVGFIADTSDIDLIITDEGLDDAGLPAFGGRVVRGAAEPNDEWRQDISRPTFWGRYRH